MKNTIIYTLIGINLCLTLFVYSVRTPEKYGGGEQVTVESAVEARALPDYKNISELETEKKITLDPELDDATVLKLLGGSKEIDGGMWFNTSIGLPPCNDKLRGLFWFSVSKPGTPDQWLGCMKDASDAYSWQVIR